jgi:hypothetical protein
MNKLSLCNNLNNKHNETLLLKTLSINLMAHKNIISKYYFPQVYECDSIMGNQSIYKEIQGKNVINYQMLTKIL